MDAHIKSFWTIAVTRKLCLPNCRNKIQNRIYGEAHEVTSFLITLRRDHRTVYLMSITIKNFIIP